MNTNAPRSVEDYLRQLRAALGDRRELFTRPEDIDYVTRLHAEDFHRFGYQPWPGAALPEPAAAWAGG